MLNKVAEVQPFLLARLLCLLILDKWPSVRDVLCVLAAYSLVVTRGIYPRSASI